jgi:1,4-alpha-glucan branching enzyme
MPGDREKQFANLRLAYGFMHTHPGKKLLFMGQDIGQIREWSEKKSIDWDVLKEKENTTFHQYVKALNKLYQKEPALYELDYQTEGFEWINNISANENIIVFLRKTTREEDTLLIVCNFVPIVRENYKVGVPCEGKYKEIFSSDSSEFGGLDGLNKRVKLSKRDECDGREDSIRITVPALGMTIFKFAGKKEKAKKTTEAKKTK